MELLAFASRPFASNFICLFLRASHPPGSRISIIMLVYPAVCSVPFSLVSKRSGRNRLLREALVYHDELQIKQNGRKATRKQASSMYVGYGVELVSH